MERIGEANRIQQDAEDDIDPEAPSSLYGCYDDNGDLDPMLYFKYQQRMSRLEEADDLAMDIVNEAILQDLLVNEDSEKVSTPPTRQRKRKRGPKGVLFYTDENGSRRILPPTLSFWFNYYCNPETCERTDHTTKWLNKFRQRFRLPYKSYLELVDMAITDPNHFQRWKPGKTDATGRECAPIHLLMLTSLRYLGRGWTFDDLEEATAISEAVCRQFFHEFILFGTHTLYPRYVNIAQLILLYQHVINYSVVALNSC